MCVMVWCPHTFFFFFLMCNIIITVENYCTYWVKLKSKLIGNAVVAFESISTKFMLVGGEKSNKCSRMHKHHYRIKKLVIMDVRWRICGVMNTDFRMMCQVWGLLPPCDVPCWSFHLSWFALYEYICLAFLILFYMKHSAISCVFICSGPTWTDQAPGSCEDPEQAEDPQSGCSGQDSPWDPEPQALQTPTHN